MPSEIKIERPAVLIGLGGTGKEVLLNLRRQFFERHGVKTLPHIAQVVIDTDGRRRHLDGSDYDEFASEVDFDDDLVVTPLNQALRNYRDNRDQYPHIDNWLDRSLDTHGDIVDGAGQIRAFGRLAFFHHYPKIKERLDRAYRTVTDRTSWDRSLEEYGIRVDPDSSGVETWLIFSVAGGTGAGMFLDTAFLARQTARRYGGGEARSIILLPTAFSSAVPQHVSDASEHRVFANAYAALMELETYNYQRSQEGDARNQMQFSVQWTPELYRQQITEVGPVFVNSWLIDNEPRGGGGQVHGERMVLCQMIAEWLFLQYGSAVPELAAPIRSNRSNDSRDLVPLAQVRIRHSEGEGPAQGGNPFDDEVILLFSRRHSSFGLSKIYIPTANLAGQAYARLVRDLTRLLLQGRTLSDTRRDVMAQLNPQLHLPRNPEVNGFTQAIVRRLSLDGGKDPLARRFQRLIQDEFEKLRLAGFDDRAEIAARDWFELEIMQKLLDSTNASTAKRGEISLRIGSENAVGTRDEMVAALDAFIARALATPGERIEFASDVLRLVLKDLAQLTTEAEDKASREELIGNRLQQELETLLTWAGDHRGFDRRKLFEAAFAKMRERAMSEFRRQVLVVTARVAGEVSQHIGTGRRMRGEDGLERVMDTGMLRALQDVREALENLGRRAEERIFAFRNQPSSALNCRVPVTGDEGGATNADAELDAIYRSPTDEPITEHHLQAIEERLYVSLSKSGFTSPWFLRDRAHATGIEESFSEMLGFASRELSYLPKRMEDALKHFDHRFRRNEMRGQYEAELDRVMRRGEPWLPPFEHNAGGSEAFRHVRAARYVACSNRAAEGARRTLLERVGECEEVSGPLDTVYFESEIAGLPLFAVRHLDLYRKAYLGYLAAPDPATRVVHVELDLEKFVDLIPFSSEEMRLRRRAIRAFIRGLVSGVICPESSEADGWQFLERSGTTSRPASRSLGRYKTAIQRLSRADSPLCSSLIREIDRHYNQNLIYDDLGRIYFAIEEMKENPPIAASEWTTAAESVLRDMREKYGTGITQDARDAGASFDKWAHRIQGRSQHPFLQVTKLVKAA